jgi:hypothetical protein
MHDRNLPSPEQRVWQVPVDSGHKSVKIVTKYAKERDLL